MKKLLFILGTRPEAIKLAPLIRLARSSPYFSALVCSTGQHREMLEQVADFFDLRPDFDLRLMTPDQRLSDLSASLLQRLDRIIEETKPDAVIVQGDTTTTMMGALSAFYHKTTIAHVEAGLRSMNRYSPFPEEGNRVVSSHLADFHFAPTEKAGNNLLKEGIRADRIHVVGNTVIDALFLGMRNMEGLGLAQVLPELDCIDVSKRMILVTGHRRESFGEPFLNICKALLEISRDENVEIVYPVHLNPHVRHAVFPILKGKKNIHLIEPVSYPAMILLMRAAYVILTDSGGVQEEGPALKRPVLVMRDVTERTEGIEAGVTRLVGTSEENIVRETRQLLYDRSMYERMSESRNPYGDGHSSGRILRILQDWFETTRGIPARPHVQGDALRAAEC